MLLSLTAGLLTMLALIVALGAQNAYVLRQGLLRRHVAWVVAICAGSDALLVVAGVAGLGAVLRDVPGALVTVQWVGVAFLATYGVLALRRAARSDALLAADGTETSLVRVVATTLALTWLNPHVYVDTVLLLGSIAQQHGATGRWWFAAGAVAGSVLWFVALGYGAARARRWLARPMTWRAIEGVVGVLMLGLAAGLALHAPA